MKKINVVSLIAILALSSGCVKKEQRPTLTYNPTTQPTVITSGSVATTVTSYPTSTSYPTPEAFTPSVFDTSQLQSSYLGGAYSSNNTLHQFINQMINKHNFNRNYLYGVFSSVSRDALALQKYNVGKPKQAKLSQPGDWDKYRAQFLTSERIGKGVQFWRDNRYYLEKAAHIYGVSPEYIISIIGVETNFGGYTGDHSVLNALTTLSLEYSARSKFFTDQLENYLLLTREQRLDPRSVKGSYAGAFGLAQFMPDSFRDYAVDHDGNGQVNIFTKADAIGSVANFFVKKGQWNPRIPVAELTNYAKTRFTGINAGGKTNYTQSYLYNLGMRPIDNFYGYRGDVSLIKLSRYSRDELWWGTPNFYAIMRYNPREHYAMAVHQLAQAVRINYYQQR